MVVRANQDHAEFTNKLLAQGDLPTPEIPVEEEQMEVDEPDVKEGEEKETKPATEEEPKEPEPEEKKEESCFWYHWLIPPEKTQCKQTHLISVGKKKFHSKMELIKSEEVSKEFSSNIIAKAEVLTYKQFMEKTLKHQLVGEEMFTRQKINESGKLSPELKHSCVCRKIINPDDPHIFACPNEACDAVLHPRCVAMAPVKKCVDCQAKISMDLYSSPKKVNARLPSPPKKRKAHPLPA
jgi:hypothetical protein